MRVFYPLEPSLFSNCVPYGKMKERSVGMNGNQARFTARLEIHTTSGPRLGVVCSTGNKAIDLRLITFKITDIKMMVVFLPGAEEAKLQHVRWAECDLETAIRLTFRGPFRSYRSVFIYRKGQQIPDTLLKWKDSFVTYFEWQESSQPRCTEYRPVTAGLVHSYR